MKIKKRNNKAMAVSQIVIFILGVVAISYALGSEIKEVKAQPFPFGPEGAIGYVPQLSVNPGGTFFQNFIRYFFSRPPTIPGVKGIAGSTALSGFVAIVGSWVTAAGAVALIYGLFALIGASQRNLANVLLTGVVVGGTTATIATIAIIAGATGPVGWVVGGITAVVTGLWSLFTYKLYSHEIFTYQPSLWQPADGGSKCEECNALEFGCNEYQCHSYGKGCELVNNPNPDIRDKFETCIWKNPLDRTPPSMTAMESVLKDDWEYVDSEIALPPNLGVKINNPPNTGTNVEGCLAPYSSVVIGVNTSEPAECRIDNIAPRATYEEMVGLMDQGPSLTYEHTLTIPNSATPSVEALVNAGWNVENGRHQEYYVRCKDANGNLAPANFIVEFCIDPSPDRTPPQILGTNYLEPSYIQHEQQTSPLTVYTDEPATCRWDRADVSYDNMANSMTRCSQELGDYIREDSYSYGCTGELTGLTDGENNFYIRCEDKPWLAEGDSNRYKSPVSEKLTLKGTSSLAITSVKINGEESNILVKGSSATVKIKLEAETLGGAEDGRAKCEYIIEGVNYPFYNGGSPEYLQKNTQELWPQTGHYTYGVYCYDKGGNSDTKQISFDVQRDNVEPSIVRLYYEAPNIRVTTDEAAKCVYDTSEVFDSTMCSYNFDEGLPMSTTDDLNHNTEANTRSVYYIKCKDFYDNQPKSSTQCTAIVRPI